MKLTGIGPILAIFGIIFILLIFGLHILTGIQIRIQSPWQDVLLVLGVFWAIVGAIIYISSANRVMRAFTAHQLETKGVYHLTRNPLYAAFIVFFIPALALLMNNLLILIASVLLFVVFKSQIHKEEDYLLKEFGQAYQQVRKGSATINSVCADIEMLFRRSCGGLTSRSS